MTKEKEILINVPDASTEVASSVKDLPTGQRSDVALREMAIKMMVAIHPTWSPTSQIESANKIFLFIKEGFVPQSGV